MALRDSPRVSEKTRKHIARLAENLGYRPDPMLAALANYRMDRSPQTIHSSIGWIHPQPEADPLRSCREFEGYRDGAAAAAMKLGYRLEEISLGKECNPKRLHQILKARGIRGLLMLPQAAATDWTRFPWDDYSVVRFGSSGSLPNLHAVAPDHVSSLTRAFDEIRKLGYQRIGLVIDGGDCPSGRLVEGAFLMAQLAAEGEYRVPTLPFGSCSAESGKTLLKWISTHRVDAILTDVPQLPQMLAGLGIAIPADIALAATSLPNADIDSGIDPFPEEVGRVGLALLNSLMTEGVRGIPGIRRQILVDGEWLRGSSMPARAGGLNAVAITGRLAEKPDARETCIPLPCVPAGASVHIAARFG